MLPSRKRKVLEICFYLERICIAAALEPTAQFHRPPEDLKADGFKYLAELNLATIWHHPKKRML
jgi:hypothetical protein